MDNRLRECREKIGMTQEELSKKSGVSRATISALENGKALCVRTDTLTKLADAPTNNTNVLCWDSTKLADAVEEKVSTIFFYP